MGIRQLAPAIATMSAASANASAPASVGVRIRPDSTPGRNNDCEKFCMNHGWSEDCRASLAAAQHVEFDATHCRLSGDAVDAIGAEIGDVGRVAALRQIEEVGDLLKARPMMRLDRCGGCRPARARKCGGPVQLKRTLAPYRAAVLTDEPAAASVRATRVPALPVPATTRVAGVVGVIGVSAWGSQPRRDNAAHAAFRASRTRNAVVVAKLGRGVAISKPMCFGGLIVTRAVRADLGWRLGRRPPRTSCRRQHRVRCAGTRW